MKKTMRMPKELLEKWTAALRSGDYTQGHKRLILELGDQKEFCCLGVLHIVADGSCPVEGLPTTDWMQSHGIVQNEDLDTDLRFFPVIWSGNNTTLTYLNDHGTPFPEIADIIEQNIEPY